MTETQAHGSQILGVHRAGWPVVNEYLATNQGLLTLRVTAVLEAATTGDATQTASIATGGMHPSMVSVAEST